MYPSIQSYQQDKWSIRMHLVYYQFYHISFIIQFNMFDISKKKIEGIG